MTILFSKDPTTPQLCASITKLMTALVAFERIPSLSDAVTILSADLVGTNESRVNFKEGDVVTYQDILHGLLIPSGNDAANCLGRTLGGMTSFLAAMNDKATVLGMTKSNFADTPGIHIDTVSSSEDITKLMAEFSKNALLVSISAKLTYPVKVTGVNARNINVEHTIKGQAYRFPELICAKTGTQPWAGYDSGGNVVALWALPDGEKRISVILGSGYGAADRYDDLRRVIDFELLRSKSNATGSVNYNIN